MGRELHVKIDGRPQPPTPPNADVARLAEAERLGALMFSIEETCVIMGFDITHYWADLDFFNAHRRGRLKEEALVRDSIITLAKAGSAPAQALAKQLIDQARVARAGE